MADQNGYYHQTQRDQELAEFLTGKIKFLRERNGSKSDIRFYERMLTHMRKKISS